MIDIDPNFLVKAFVIGKMSVTDISAVLGCGRATISRSLTRYGLSDGTSGWKRTGVHPNTGKTLSETTRMKISVAHMGKVVPVGDKSHAWKGGRWVDSYGYVRVHAKGHPRAIRSPYMKEHTLVAERKYGRLIERGEHVHHINGIKSDNRPENLEVLSHAEHSRRHRQELKQVVRQTVGLLGRTC